MFEREIERETERGRERKRQVTQPLLKKSFKF
jgi:hypothetical protein